MKEIFGDVSRPPARLGSRAWYMLPASIAAHAAMALIAIIVPLMAADSLPSPSTVLPVLVGSPEPPPPPPAPVPISEARQARPAPQSNPLAVITAPADGIVDEAVPPSVPDTPGGTTAGIPQGIPGSTGPVTLMPPAPPPVTRTAPVRLSHQIKRPEKIRDVRPVYPQLALANRVEGLVIVEAVIGTDGRVTEARVLKSIPLLDRAALDAVMQWQFTPTLLNGVPVPVIMTVTVNFTLRN